MKKWFLLISIFIVINGFSQDTTDVIEGTWTGYFTTDESYDIVNYTIVFSKIKDSLYEAVGVTYFTLYGKLDTTVCMLDGRTKKGELVLDETKIVSSTLLQENNCLQRFFLKFKKGKILEGVWESAGRNNCGRGKIFLTKKEE